MLDVFARRCISLNKQLREGTLEIIPPEDYMPAGARYLGIVTDPEIRRTFTIYRIVAGELEDMCGLYGRREQEGAGAAELQGLQADILRWNAHLNVLAAMLGCQLAMHFGLFTPEADNSGTTIDLSANWVASLPSEPVVTEAGIEERSPLMRSADCQGTARN